MPSGYGPGYAFGKQIAGAAAASGAESSKSFGRLGLMLGIGGVSVAALAGITYFLTGGDNDNSVAVSTEGVFVLDGDSSRENGKPRVVLHQSPRGYTLPSISPISLKLETFLRVAKIPYEVRIHSGPSDEVREPWLTVGEESIHQAYDCVPTLSKAFGIDLEKGARGSRLTASRLVGVMLENRLYWGISIWRWIHDKGVSLLSIQPFRSSEASENTIAEVTESVWKAAFYNGLGRRRFDEIVDIISKDLADLSAALGKHPFFLGETPGEIDCTAFAMLAQIIFAMPNCPFRTELQNYPNLCEFLIRMRETFWGDWSEVLAKPGDGDESESFFYPLNEFNLPTAQEGGFNPDDYAEIDSSVYRNFSAVSTPARCRSTVSNSKRAPQVQFEAHAQPSSSSVGDSENGISEFENLYQLLEELKEKVDEGAEEEEPAEGEVPGVPATDAPHSELPSRHQAKQVENFDKLKTAQQLLDTINQRLVASKNEKPPPPAQQLHEQQQQKSQSPGPNFPANNNQVFNQSQQQLLQPQPESFLQNPGMPQHQQHAGNPQHHVQYFQPGSCNHFQPARSRPVIYYGNMGMMRGAPGGIPPMGMGPVHYAPIAQPVYYSDMGLGHQQGMIPAAYQNADMTMPTVPMQQQPQHQHYVQHQHQQQQPPQYMPRK